MNIPRMISVFFAIAITLISARVSFAAETTIPLVRTTVAGVGEEIGNIRVQDSKYGLLLQPNLSGLVPGVHGFHVHQNPDCGPGIKDSKSVPGLAAGGHYDPATTNQHLGPYGSGHLGDLPPLLVDKDGVATMPGLAPRLAVADLKGHSLTVHAGSDNFSDQPSPLGGGGARVACGVVN